jgi:hypothetical protein
MRLIATSPSFIFISSAGTGVPCLGRVKFKVVAEIFSGPRVLCRHQGPTFRAYISDVVADVAW